MRIVATGATSFVGAGAVRELLRRGHEVCAVLREHSVKADRLKENGVFPERLTVLEADLGELSRLTEWIEEPCDVFLHMGWRGAGSGDRGKEEIQRESVRDALGAVRTAALLGCKRFLFTGSQAEYGVHDCLTDEETPCGAPGGEGALQAAFHGLRPYTDFQRVRAGGSPLVPGVVLPRHVFRGRPDGAFGVYAKMEFSVY